MNYEACGASDAPHTPRTNVPIRPYARRPRGEEAEVQEAMRLARTANLLDGDAVVVQPARIRAAFVAEYVAAGEHDDRGRQASERG